MQGGLNANIESGVVCKDSKDSNKVILNIKEAHNVDNINAKSLGFIINSDIKHIDYSELHKSHQDSLHINSFGAETISAKFDPFYDYRLHRDTKCGDEPKYMITDQSLKIFSKEVKREVIEITSDISSNTMNDKILEKTSTKEGTKKNEVIDVDEGHSYPKIKTLQNKKSKNDQSKFISIFGYPSQKSRVSKLDVRKCKIDSINHSCENSEKKSSTTRKKTAQMKQGTKSVDTQKRYFKGIKYLSKLIKGAIIFKKVKTNKEIAAEVCNFILSEERDIEAIKKYKRNDIALKNIYRRVYDAQNILAGACILEKRNKSIFLPETSFYKEVYQQKLCEAKAPYNKLKYKRLELVGMIKKYAIIKHYIERNKAHASEARIYLPFVTIGRGANKGGYVKAENILDEKKAYVTSEINLKMHGDLQSLMIFKACRQIPDNSYNAYIKEVTQKIEQKFNYVPEYLKGSIPK